MKTTEKMKLVINMIVKAAANSGDENYGGNERTIKKVRKGNHFHSVLSHYKLKRMLRDYLAEHHGDLFKHPVAFERKGVVQQKPTNEDPLSDIMLLLFGYFYNEDGSNGSKTYTRKSAFDTTFIHSITPYHNDVLQFSNGGIKSTMGSRDHHGANIFKQEVHPTFYPIHIVIHLDAFLKNDTFDILNLDQFTPEYLTKCVITILNRLHLGLPDTSNGFLNTYTPWYFDAYLSGSGIVGASAWSYSVLNDNGRDFIKIHDYWRAFIDEGIIREETPDKEGKKIVGYIEHKNEIDIPPIYKNRFLYAVDPNNDWGDDKSGIAEQQRIWPRFLEDLEKRLLDFFTRNKNKV